MSKTVTCNTLVWLRDQQFDKGTKFDVVDAPKAATEVDPATVERWEMNDWLVPSASKAGPAGEGA